MGLLAVMGPSRNDQRGPPAVCARSFWKIWRSSQKRKRSRSIAGKSGILGTGLYIFIWRRKAEGIWMPENSMVAFGGRGLTAVGRDHRSERSIVGIAPATEFTAE